MNLDKLNVLVISRSPWDIDNSTGNTLSNIFNNSKFNLANIYCREGHPNNSLCTKYYKMSETLLIKKLFGVGTEAGIPFDIKDLYEELNAKNDFKKNNMEKRLYDIFRSNRMHILLWLRELLWGLASWKNENLNKFILGFNPQIIFMWGYDVFYMHSVLKYVNSVSDASVLLFHTDDYSTSKQYSLNPFFWINRFILQKKIMTSINISSHNYCITEKQRDEYEEIYTRKFGLLRKGGDFSSSKYFSNKINNPIKLIYVGNITSARYKTLGRIGRVLQKINKGNIVAQLFIYTQNKLTKKMNRCLDIKDSIILKGSIPNKEVKNVLNQADVLIHVESFSLKEKLETRLSFSTKIVDYFQAARCIFAVGWSKAASINYLIQNDAAMVACNEEEIEEKLRMLIDHPELIGKYGRKGWECGKRNHQIETIQKEFFIDLQEVTKMA